MAKQRVGFLGLGAMGGAMARRLAQLGFSVTGYDVSAKRTEVAASEGVGIAASAAAAAEHADVVMSSLPNPAAVRAAYLGATGAVATLRSGAVLIDLSTIDPQTWQEVAEAAGPAASKASVRRSAAAPPTPAAADSFSSSAARHR